MDKTTIILLGILLVLVFVEWRHRVKVSGLKRGTLEMLHAGVILSVTLVAFELYGTKGLVAILLGLVTFVLVREIVIRRNKSINNF